MQIDRNATPAGRPDLVLATTLYLLSNCSLRGAGGVEAQAVVHHLELIAANEQFDTLVRSTGAQLLQQWKEQLSRIADGSRTQTAPSNALH